MSRRGRRTPRIFRIAAAASGKLGEVVKDEYGIALSVRHGVGNEKLASSNGINNESWRRKYRRKYQPQNGENGVMTSAAQRNNQRTSKTAGGG